MLQIKNINKQQKNTYQIDKCFSLIEFINQDLNMFPLDKPYT